MYRLVMELVTLTRGSYICICRCVSAPDGASRRVFPRDGINGPAYDYDCFVQYIMTPIMRNQKEAIKEGDYNIVRAKEVIAKRKEVVKLQYTIDV